MRLLALLLLVVACWGDVRISVDETGAYNISVNDQLWLCSSRVAIYVDDRWYSTENDSLPLVSITEEQGTDPNLGNWNETVVNYELVRGNLTTPIAARIRQWSTAPAFTFYLETGYLDLTNKLVLDFEQIRTAYPSFNIEKNEANDSRGYFTFGGAMTGEAQKHAGVWNANSSVITSAMQGGPVVIFDANSRGEADMLVLSPFSHFMATSLYQRNTPSGSVLEYGVIGSMTTIPSLFTQSFMVFYSPHGINEGVREWGETMQRAFARTNVNRLTDLTINYLGYYTDNGGYYYYNTEQGQNYEQTIISAQQQIKLPFHYMQLDSWWYYKGLQLGVSEWRARPDVFPDGLQALHVKLNNTPFAAHNRYWAYDNVYKQKYSFVLDIANSKALPVGNDSFWLDLLVEARNWGLVLYEQDWLNVQTLEFLPTRTDIDIGEQWLKSMGAAADQVGINIQYCMSLPRHILQAIEIPRVTHARASDDYAVNLQNAAKPQWNIGVSSMLADAMGIAPFKDVLWSTDVQPGSPYGAAAIEQLPDRAILISTLSTGPVGPGDGINFTNTQRIMRCCRSDGLILKPDRPLTTINEVIADWAANDGVLPGELYSTTTTISDRDFHVIFASAMKRDYTVYPSMIESEAGVVWSYDNAQVVSTFDDSHFLSVTASKCTDMAICLWYVSPLWQFNDAIYTKYALLGELNKWTAVSRQRFLSITTNTEKTQTTIVVQGAAAETVSVVVYNANQGTTIVNCLIPNENGVANLVITPTNAVCA